MALAITGHACTQPLNGYYTVGPTGSYTTLAAAIGALQANGVSGPVFMNIQSGTYTGSWTINAIAGTSATNRVTFRSQTLVQSDVILANPALSGTITFNGCAFVTLEAVTVTSAGNVIQLSANPPDIIMRNCAITSTYAYGVGVSASSTRPDRLLIEGCTINAPYTGVSLISSTFQPIADPVVRNNTITGVNQAGILTRFVTGVTVEGNTVTSSGASTATYVNGIDVRDANGVIVIRRNTVNWGIGTHALYLDNCLWPAGSPPVVENNMFLLTGGNAAGATVSLLGTDRVHFRHNSVRSTVVRHAVQVQFCDNVVLQGNIMETTAEEVLMTQTASFSTIDRNVYYCTQPNVIRWSVFTYYNWATWQGLGWDSNSVFADPLFMSATDLHIQSGSPAQELLPMPELVPTDRDGDLRGTTTTLRPDAGADERTDPCGLGLFGTYPVGPSANAIFPTMASAVSALVSCGVSGPVVMAIESGTYTANVSVPAIPGTSAVNTVVFRSAALDSTAVVLNTGSGPKVELNGCSHVSFTHITATATVYAVRIVNGAADCGFSNCRLVTTHATSGLGVSNNNTVITRPFVHRNVIVASSQGILFNVPAGSYVEGVDVRANQVTVSASSSGAIDVIRSNGVHVEGNSVISTGTATATYTDAIGLSDGIGAVKVLANDITWSLGSSCVRLEPFSTLPLDPPVIANNMLRKTAGAVQSACITLTGANGTILRHNSMRASAAFRCLSSSACSNLILEGNAMQADAAPCMSLQTTTYASIDRNIYFNSTGTPFFVPPATNISMAAWQALGRDANGLNMDPLFVSATDLHLQPTSPAIALGPLPSPLVTDFDGEGRAQPAGDRPDAGADERPEGCTTFNGIYTIGTAPGSDFGSFKHAVLAMANCGINGPVTFLVQSGTYAEQFTLPPIPGNSAANTITFRSAALDSAAVLVQWPSSAAATSDWVVRMDGADHVTFDRITLERTGSANYGTVLTFNSTAGSAGSQYTSLTSCRLLSGTGAFSVLITSPANGDEDSVVVQRCRLQGGWKGLVWSATTDNDRLRVEENVFTGQSFAALQLDVRDRAFLVRRNTINMTGPTGVGIQVGASNAGFEIGANRVRSTAYHGLVFSGDITASLGGQRLVVNNMITGGQYGVLVSGGTGLSDMRMDNNSVFGTVTGVYFGAGTIQLASFRNNALSSQGLALYRGATTTLALADHVLLHRSTAGPIAYWGANQNTLAALQAASGLFSSSVVADPLFFDLANGDLHAYAMELDGAGTPLASVLRDHDGQLRHATTPDIGADEFQPQLWADALSTCAAADPITSTGSGTDRWIYKDRKVLARFNDNGQNLGTVQLNVFLNNGPVRTSDLGQHYLDRNWHLVTQNAISSSATIRLFFSGAEFAPYAAADPLVTGLTDAGTAHYVGVNENCLETDNPAGQQWTGMFPVSNGTEPRINATGGTLYVTPVITNDGELYVTGLGQVLPVELLTFTGERVNERDVLLMWATANEHNNAGFEVWRMNEGEADFAEVGWMDGAGDAQQRTDYAFTDANAAERTSYYKLKQVDSDGRSTWSPVVAVGGGGRGPELVAFPNPATEWLMLEGLPEDEWRIDLLDASGRSVRTWIGVAQIAGLDDLPRGMYNLVVSSEHDRRSLRISLH